MKPILLPMQEVKPALVGLGKVIDRRSPLPVLNHIKVERTKDGWVALTATDLDVFATVRLEQPVEGEPVALLVPLADLQTVAKSCGKADTITIRCGKIASELSVEYPVGAQQMQTQVPTLPVDEFPEIPRIKGDSTPLPDALRSSLHEAFDCASVDETRLVLNSAYIDVSDAKGHYVVGTNGSHLYASNSFSLPLKDCVIIPTHKFLGFKDFNNDGEWQLKLGEKPDKDTPAPVQLASRRWRFICKQHHENYPNWKQVLPGNGSFNTGVSLAPASLDVLVKTIERLPQHDTVNHTLGFEVIGKQVHLLCKANKEAPWTKVKVTEVTTEGKDITIFLNRIYVVKALSFGLDRLETIDAKSPARFSNSGRQMIVMPVRVEADPTPAKPVPAAEPKAEETKPAAPPAAAQPKEETPMAENNGTSPAATLTLDAQLDQCIDDIETLKEGLQANLSSLTSLRAKLKIIQREHKASTKELQSVRQTLKSLQTVKL